MRKLSLSVLCLFILAFSACSVPARNPSIDEPVIAKSVDMKTSKPIEASSTFSQSDPVIYFSIRIKDLPEDTKLKAVWKYLGDGTEIPAEIITKGTGYEVFTLKRSGSQFPDGQYEVTVTAPVEGKKLEAKGKFSVIAEAKPAHLLNPVTSKGVESSSNLNPVDITSMFSQSDLSIYFVVQSQNLPAGTTVSCVWYYVDTGDSLTSSLVTDGDRNIAFTLSPEEGKKLPAGKYIVTAATTINGETESVSSQFEIGDNGD